MNSSRSAGVPAAREAAVAARRALRVLVVDDEVLLAEAVAQAFESDGWQTRVTTRGRDAALMARDLQPDVIVLDIMLPDIDGFAVLDRVRQTREETRILFLTARDAQEDRLEGLRAGGDDYLTKPFSVAELIARAHALARTSMRVPGGALAGPAADGGLRAAALSIDEESREVYRGHERLDLTSTEFELLRFFARNPRRVLSRDEILAAVWGYDFGATSNLVEMYVSYLRRKLVEPADPVIGTVRGAGYILKEPPERQP